MTAPLKFLLAIPAYRESRRLPVYLGKLAEALERQFPGARIQVVDDGSGEAEQNLLREKIKPIAAQYSCLLETIWLEENKGKGGAVLTAWDRGNDYPYLGFVDADGAVSPEEVCRVASLLGGDGDPVFFGSRIKMLGRSITRTTARHFMGRFFAFLVGVMIDPGIYDSQCGLKFIPQAGFQAVRGRLRGHRFAFDVELLAALKTSGWPVLEVPIDWEDVPGSKVRLMRDTIRMVTSLWQIRKERLAWMSQRKNR
ncbi:MAG: glycosyltransferase [Candidatus Methylacidiphilales bacterium]|nr:glycosyltransferase [Candidatus Methylacidiphilales bacterium]